MSSDIEYAAENGITDERGNVNPSFWDDWAEELQADIEAQEAEDAKAVKDEVIFKGIKY